MGYPIEMKKAVIRKVLMGGKPHHEIARDAGIGRSTLTYWLKHYKKGGNMNLTQKERRPQDWTAEERINALMATGAMSEGDRVSWCRKRGVFAHHLEQWKKDVISLLTTNKAPGKSKDAIRLKKENTALKKELNRKDKALAELAVLLVLKKKADSIWGSPGTIDQQRRQKRSFGADPGGM
jgi:transposase